MTHRLTWTLSDTAAAEHLRSAAYDAFAYAEAVPCRAPVVPVAEPKPIVDYSFRGMGGGDGHAR